MKISNKIGGRRKNVIFWSTFSKNCPKTPFLTCFFFQNLPEALKVLSKLVLYSVLGAFKINLILAEKKFDKIFEKFLKVRIPPRENNSRSAPA